MKKLPDVKMGHTEGKNLTFSSDSEDPVNNPNFVSNRLSRQALIFSDLFRGASCP